MASLRVLDIDCALMRQNAIWGDIARFIEARVAATTGETNVLEKVVLRRAPRGWLSRRPMLTRIGEICTVPSEDSDW